MTLFEISGGLGNQIFQFATARWRAAQRDGALHANLYFLRLHLQSPRRYLLERFKVRTGVVPGHHVWRYSSVEFVTRLTRLQFPASSGKRLLSAASGVESACRYRFHEYQPGVPKPALKNGEGGFREMLSF